MNFNSIKVRLELQNLRHPPASMPDFNSIKVRLEPCFECRQVKRNEISIP